MIPRHATLKEDLIAVEAAGLSPAEVVHFLDEGTLAEDLWE
jgi:hypothetical protein